MFLAFRILETRVSHADAGNISVSGVLQHLDPINTFLKINIGINHLVTRKICLAFYIHVCRKETEYQLIKWNCYICALV